MHKHLTWTDRLKIEKWLKEGMSVYKIADKLRVHNTTIYAELKRGRYKHLTTHLLTEYRYSPEIAEARYRRNLQAKGQELKIGKDREFAEYIEKKIADEKYSPAAVLAEIKIQGIKFDTEICEKTIYNYIDKGIFLRLTNKELPRKGRRKQRYRKIRAAKAPAGESIEKRPEEINNRESFGHWEMDCVIGKKKSKAALLVLTERYTRMELICKIRDKTAASVVNELDRLEKIYKKNFPLIFKTITVDNGAEFSQYDGMERSIFDFRRKRTKIYYCHPYSAFE